MVHVTENPTKNGKKNKIKKQGQVYQNSNVIRNQKWKLLKKLMLEPNQ